ncbi:MAG: chloride channel protein [Nitrospinales bacterium]
MRDMTEKIRGEFRKYLAHDHNLLILAGIIGCLAGFASTAFRWMIGFFDAVFSKDGLIMLYLPESLVPYLLPMAPMVGGLLIGLIVYYYPNAVKENGVHKVMQAVALKDGKIPKRTIFTCATTSSITIGSGGSAGREGPTVQIGAAIGSTFGQFFHLSTDRTRVLVGCGAAAGIAASFNAPIAGVLFSMEIILGNFAIRTFSPIVIASVIGTVTGRALEGNEITFTVPVHDLVSHSEIFIYVLLGILCGLASRLFIICYFGTQKFFEEKVKLPQPLKPALGGLIVGLISIIFPQILGNGYPLMQDALNGNLFWGLAIGLVFMKIFATSITLGSGGMGGIFAPSLFIGAMVGAALGSGVHAVFPNITASPETYAMVGMGAMAGAVMQAPLTNILMLFELTNDYTMILPIMICCIVSAYTLRLFSKNSVYIQYLLNKGINIQHGREFSILNTIHVRDVMNSNIVTITKDMPFKKILETISYSKNFYYPVVNEEGDMIGILSFSDIREVIFEEGLADLVVANDLATKNVVTLSPSHNLNEAMEIFATLDVDQLPVVKVGDDKKVIGMLTRGDVIAVYSREVLVHDFER